ncbi:hypothetical protein BS47DRAFT_1353637 [Hydnum rufescens UP504]|uniref:Uncharacterized protein n=1 Tax=Hydnum rufescens UP504 TaxID=1448309 RepID=A0A9P6DLE1_9AGAM|nr:hypothetical protein BS47DRAFT_1353637 [Hydnum rufescens UP504]
MVYPSSSLEDGEVKWEAAADAHDKSGPIPVSRDHTPPQDEDRAERLVDFSSNPRVTRSRFRASRPPSLDLRHSNFDPPTGGNNGIQNKFTHHRYGSVPTLAGLLTPLSDYGFSPSGSSSASASGPCTGSSSSPPLVSFSFLPTAPPSPVSLSPRLEAMTLEGGKSKVLNVSSGFATEEQVGEAHCNDDLGATLET